MGYDIHITRARSWLENAGMEIRAEEWLKVVAEDPELHLAGFNGPYFALWKSLPEDWDGSTGWLNWRKGNIYAKGASESLIGKMLDIANRLGARVQGDDMEIYGSGNYNDYHYDD
jgi:hypothetical protein